MMGAATVAFGVEIFMVLRLMSVCTAFLLSWQRF
jgi:hypothetical protein